MDFKKAIKILELDDNFTEDNLRKAYYKKALRWHPDKNKDGAATARFMEIGEAYTFLQKHKKVTFENIPSTLSEIIERCLLFLKTENKWDDIKRQFINLKLHMIGKLQTNKAKKAVKLFDYIHSLDNAKLASKIFQYEKELNKKIKIFIQVNLGQEDQKAGIQVNELKNFYKYCTKELSLNIIGSIPACSSYLPDIIVGLSLFFAKFE